MKKDKKLFEQAILDAKSIRQASLANAKAALAETLTPKLQKMLAKKLQEQEEKEVNESEELDENAGELDEELDLDEILAELELEEGGDTPLNESFDADLEEGEDKEDKPKDSKPKSEPKSDSSSSPKPKADDSGSDFNAPADFGGEGEGEEMVSDEDKVSTLTVADLKNIVRDVFQSEVSMGDDAALGAPGTDDLGGEEGLDDPSLGGSPDTFGADADPGSVAMPNAHGMDGGDDYDDDDIDLEELLAELEGKAAGQPVNETEKLRQENAQLKADLEEAKKAVGVYRKELNEQNLLNAKLLYVNRIFKAKNLTESQKVKVITTFDKVTNVKDAKLVYEALNAGGIASKTSAIRTKKPITESRGFASKPAGMAPKSSNPIVDDNADRWKYLAGIKKNRF